MTLPTRLAEFRAIGDVDVISLLDFHTLIDALEAAVELLHVSSDMMRKSNKGESVEDHEKAEVIALVTKFDAALARLGGGE